MDSCPPKKVSKMLLAPPPKFLICLIWKRTSQPASFVLSESFLTPPACTLAWNVSSFLLQPAGLLARGIESLLSGLALCRVYIYSQLQWCVQLAGFFFSFKGKTVHFFSTMTSGQKTACCYLPKTGRVLHAWISHCWMKCIMNRCHVLLGHSQCQGPF